ncbi:MAG: phage tail tape measure protein, partial [Oscillospiraceae bacterium]|nr:phage tail tape measure protein [Oscillospiraceae bacterium]
MAQADGSIVIDTKLDETGLTKGLKNIGKVAAAGIAAAAGAITAFAAYATKVGSDFEKEMSNLQAITQAANEEMSAMQSGIREIAVSTGMDLGEIAKNAKMVAEAGGDVGLMMEQLSHGTNLALATQTDMATTLDFLGSTMKTFGIEAENTQRVVDSFSLVTSLANVSLSQLGESYVNVGGNAALLGMSINEVNAHLINFSNAGLKGGAAGTSLNSILKNLSTPTQKAADELDALGVALYDSTGASRDMMDIMRDLETALSGMTDEQRNASEAVIFDSVAQKGWNMITAEGIDNIIELSAELSESGNSFDVLGQAAGMAAMQIDNFQGDVNILKAGIADLSVSVYKGFQPVLREVTQFATELISTLSDAFNEGGFEGLAGAAGDVLAQVVTKITEYIPTAGEMGVKLLVSFIDGIVDNSDVVTDAALGIGEVLINGIITLIPKLIEAGYKLSMGLLDGLSETLPKLAGTAVEMVIELVKVIADEAPRFLTAAAEIVKNLAKGLGEAVPIIKPITVVISSLMNLLQKLAPFVLAAAAAFAAFQIVMAIANGIKAMTLALTSFNLVTVISTALQWAFNTAMMANPIGAIIAAIAALVVGIIALVMWLNTATEDQKALQKSTEDLVEANNKLTDSMNESAASYEDKLKGMRYEEEAALSLADKISMLSMVEEKSAEQKMELAALIDIFNEAMGESIIQYDMETDSMNRNVAEIYNIITARQEEARLQAARERAVEIAKEQMAVEDQLLQIEKQREILTQAVADGVYKKGENDKKYKKIVEELNKSEAELVARQVELSDSFETTTQVVAESAAKQAEANAAIIASSEEVIDAMVEQYKIQAEIEAERKKAAKEVTDALIVEANKQGLTLEEYRSHLEETQKAEEKIYSERQKAIENYTKAATEMFKKISETSEVSVSEMTANLEHNQRVIGEWAKNIAKLTEMGIDEGLLKKLEDAGPESAGLVNTLVKSSQTELDKLSGAFANGSKVATDALLKQLGLPDVVNSGSDMVDKIAEGVDSNDALNLSTENLIIIAKETAEETVTVSDFPAVGESIVDGVWEGFLNKEAEFRKQVSEFFNKIVKDVKSELGIASPSKVFYEIGGNLIEGLSLGISENAGKAVASITEVGETVRKVFAALGIEDFMHDKGAEAIQAFYDGMMKYGTSAFSG